MSLWLKISLHNKKWSEESLILIYKATHGELFSLVEGLENVIQLGWFRTSTSSSLFLLLELGIEWIIDQDSSWIKIISKSDWVLRMVLTIEFFFWMFCEKIYKSLKKSISL